MRFKPSHAYAAIGVATLGMIFQVHLIAEGSAACSDRLVHHAKQLVALIPKLVCDFACILSMGPSPRAVPSWHFFLGGFISILLVHGAKTQATIMRYAAEPSLVELIFMIQAVGCTFLHMFMFILHRPCGARAWLCYRACHALVGASSIALCLYLRLYAQSARGEFPPSRGSFEGSILAYGSFIALSLWLTPARRLWLHGGLCEIIPWLPLSEIKRDELVELLRAEDVPGAANSPGLRRRGRAVRKLPSEQSVSNGGDEEFNPVDLHCDASTIGSNSEVADLSGLMMASEQRVPEPAFDALPVPTASYSPAFYQRERALRRTLHELGITFPGEGDRGGLGHGSSSCSSSSS
jgi:hypothetical protein